jgi:hypothetical protein
MASDLTFWHGEKRAIPVTLEDGTGVPIPITGWTITAHLKLLSPGVDLNLTVQTVDASAGKFQIVVDLTATTATATYARLIVTMIDQAPQTMIVVTTVVIGVT